MILSGFCRLGRKPELRYLTDGGAVCNLSLAFNWGKKDGNGKRPTTWVDAALWGKRAEALIEYLDSGQPLDVVVNDVHIELYKKSDGSTGAALRGTVLSIDFAGKAAERGEETAPKQAAQPKKPPAGFDDFEDDIPF